MATAKTVPNPNVPPPPPLYVLTLDEEEARDLRALTGASVAVPDTLYAIHCALSNLVPLCHDPANFEYGEYTIQHRETT